MVPGTLLAVLVKPGMVGILIAKSYSEYFQKSFNQCVNYQAL